MLLTHRTTRRHFCGKIGSGLLVGWLPLGSQVSAADMQPIWEFRNTTLRAISPDGKNCAFYSTEVPTEVALVSPDGVAKLPSDHRADTLFVWNLDSGKVIFQKEVGTRVTDASFFADGKKLFYLTLEGGGGGTRISNTVVDLDRNASSLKRTSNELFYKAVGQDRLIAISGREDIVKVALPDYREIERVPLGASPGDRWERVTLDRVAADRSLLVYALDRQRLMCRRTADLGRLLWSRSIDAQFRLGAIDISLSPNGSWLAVGCVEKQLRGTGGATGITVFDARSGEVVARLGLDPYERIGISPDGKMLAVGDRRKESTGETVTAVYLYDVATGKELGRVEHQRRVLGAEENLLGGLAIDGIQFSSDGKYLLTSGHNVRIWRLH